MSDYFDEAETNQDIKLNQSELDFPEKMKDVASELAELRANPEHEELIPEHLIHAAVNQYIDNALQLNDNTNIVSVHGSLNFNGVNEEHESPEERRLKDKIYNISKNDDEYKNFGFADKKISNQNTVRNQGIANLLEKGNLFDINLDDVYKSVGKTQIKNFEKMYSNKFIN